MVTFVSFAQAGDLPRYLLGGDVIHGGNDGHAKAGADTINFTGLSGTNTIIIGSQLPTITEDLTITGPGSATLTVDAASGAYRVFEISPLSTRSRQKVQRTDPSNDTYLNQGPQARVDN